MGFYSVLMFSFVASTWSMLSLASPINQHQKVSVKQAQCLGFKIKQTTEQHIELQYPSILDESWQPIATMVEYQLNGQPSFVVKTPFDKAQQIQPSIQLGFYDPIDTNRDAHITISYRCTIGCQWPYSKTFTMPPVSLLLTAENRDDLDCESLIQ